MNNKALTLSILFAIVAVFFVQSYVSSVEEEQKKKFGAEITVVVAKRDIKEMATIDETMLTTIQIPERFKDPNAVPYSKPEVDEKSGRKIGLGLKEWAGYIANVPIKKGEQLTFTKVTEPGIKTGLSPQITPGKRAMAINVNEISGVSKLVKPGDRVDVIGVIDLGGGKGNKIAKTLLQDVIVLATGRNVSNNPARTIESDSLTGKERIKSLTEDYSFSSVTIEVDPVQAQMLALVMQNGESALMLSLRNNEDTERGAVGTMSYGDVLGIDLSKSRAPASKP
jgi:pilus assembly protein CpaB